jgi:predicted nucleic acid-binding protein
MRILYDSSVYIGGLRGDPTAALMLERWRRKAPLWVSAVVLEELYAGANRAAAKLIDKLASDFERAGRVVVPSLSDWTQTGRVLERIRSKYGLESKGLARLTNDTLIATSAFRCGVTVLTANARDFARIAEFCPVEWRAE